MKMKAFIMKGILYSKGNRNALKNKKAIHKSGKLFIGLTTKPATSYKVVAKTTQLSFGVRLLGQKRFPFPKTFSQFCGLDGTRTRDPMRDRHVF